MEQSTESKKLEKNDGGELPQKDEKKDTSSSSKEETKKPSSTQRVLKESDFDITTPCWFYLDSNNLRQGPFSFKEMYLWWKGTYFPNDLPVKTVWEAEFTPLNHLPEFTNIPQSIVEKIEKEQEEAEKKGVLEVPLVSGIYDASSVEYRPMAPAQDIKYKDYVVQGGFNPHTGRFQTHDSGTFQPKGGPATRDERMMSHYFDIQAYQEQMNTAKEQPQKKKGNNPKMPKKFWKERKEKKKRAKLLAEYLAD